MNALTLLQQRSSSARLIEPAPSEAELNEILIAASRAPDHARLRPWRFRLVQGEAREHLGQVFADAAAVRNPDCSDSDLQRFKAQPLRAPLILVVSAVVVEHPKVPPIEQQLAAGCAAYGALLATEALGYAGIWRTGAHAFDRTVMRGLGMADNEEIVGFLYIGSRDGGRKTLPEPVLSEFVQTWTGN
ncbi:nitroreductase [Spongiibacter nanhainus]|uniref:Putative NAD(P)H nitroreductase n=1 Tax=Spongiibacter nanhainus TaxID=2794344 RepID=A0A7T4URA8_9GAMM|nr:nitroreductase [Spongiibacter nanhainus]QQD19623.1 nitroreductase [Spongiibacter nanhainus]